MRKVILATMALLMLLITPAYAQAIGPVIVSSSSLAWDYSLVATGVQSFRIYLSRTPGIVPSGAPTATVAFPTLVWPLAAGTSGQWYAVVTALTTTGIESNPSNELPFFVLDAPTSLRVVP